MPLPALGGRKDELRESPLCMVSLVSLGGQCLAPGISSGSPKCCLASFGLCRESRTARAAR